MIKISRFWCKRKLFFLLKSFFVTVQNKLLKKIICISLFSIAASYVLPTSNPTPPPKIPYHLIVYATRSIILERKCNMRKLISCLIKIYMLCFVLKGKQSCKLRTLNQTQRERTEDTFHSFKVFIVIISI